MTEFSLKDTMQPRGFGLMSRRGFLSMSAALGEALVELLEDGVRKVVAGLTTIPEILRIAHALE